MHSLPMTCSKNDLYSVSIELVPNNATSCMFEATPCHWPFITKYTIGMYCFKLTVQRSNYRERRERIQLQNMLILSAYNSKFYFVHYQTY